MGQSTDAMVFYGYCWPDEDTEFDTDLDEVVKAILASRGHADPWDAHYVGPKPFDAYKAWAATQEGAAEVESYRALKAAVEQELGVDWGSHCSGECSMPYLFIRDTEITANRGYPKPLDPGSFTVDPSWKGKLDAFLESQGIEPPEGENQPGWWTASWWG
jgi:hypothetical protein